MVPQHGPFSLHKFTLCLRASDYMKELSQHPWSYGLWMRVKGPHHYKVAALGSCVKWPLAKGEKGEGTRPINSLAGPFAGFNTKNTKKRYHNENYKLRETMSIGGASSHQQI